MPETFQIAGTIGCAKASAVLRFVLRASIICCQVSFRHPPNDPLDRGGCADKPETEHDHTADPDQGYGQWRVELFILLWLWVFDFVRHSACLLSSAGVSASIRSSASASLLAIQPIWNAGGFVLPAAAWRASVIICLVRSSWVMAFSGLRLVWTKISVLK